MNLNKLRDKAYQCAVKHGWHEEEHSNEHWLCLVISELMEAVEADRKGDYAGGSEMKELFEEDLAAGEDFTSIFESHLKDTVEDELADVCIRILDLAGLRDVNLSSVSFPISNSAKHIEERRILSFTEWSFDVTSVIARYKEDSYPIGYLFIGILQEICCMAEILGFDLSWHIEQKMKFNELRPYKHGDKKY